MRDVRANFKKLLYKSLSTNADGHKIYTIMYFGLVMSDVSSKDLYGGCLLSGDLLT